MKRTTKTIMLAAVFAVAGTVQADNPPASAVAKNGGKQIVSADSYLWDAARPDSHAPIGVKGEHTHEAGEVMLSYRFMYMSMDGHRAGTDKLSSRQVYHRGYDVAAESMDMYMHMFGLMYAPTDWLTLMAMLNYVEKDMDLKANPHMHGGHGHEAAHGGHTGSFSHSSDGIGDTVIGALIKVYDDNRQRVHLNLALGLPTADVDAKEGGVFLPYGMQSGYGVWDIRPGVTYLGQYKQFSWGAQVTGIIGLESANDSGFSYGDSVTGTAWLACMLSDWASVSTRAIHSYQDSIDGHYNGSHGHTAPPHFQENYGGHSTSIGLGLNLYGRQGILKGHRLAVEVILPVYQDLKGVGMNADYSIVAGWQKAW